MRQYGVPVAEGYPAFSAAEAVAAAKKLPGPVWVVKAQIHAGGRGKGQVQGRRRRVSGVRLAKSIEEVERFAGEMLGKTLVTIQTGPPAASSIGSTSRTARRSRASSISRRFVDRASSRVAFIASEAGGMDIEQVAHDTPEWITTLSVDPATGLQPFHGRRIASALGLKGHAAKQCGRMVADLYRMVVEKDMSLSRSIRSWRRRTASSSVWTPR